jgi:hypothetical protein
MIVAPKVDSAPESTVLGARRPVRDSPTRGRWWMILLVGLVGGCNHNVDSHLQPYFPAEFRPEPLLDEAIRIEPGQAPVLLTHGATVVGVVRLSQANDGFSVAGFEDFRREAPRAAAKAGGTHFTIAASGSEGQGRHGLLFAAYIVWRVEPDRWSKLPVELQPRVQ